MNRFLLLGSALLWVVSACGGGNGGGSKDTTAPTVANPQRGIKR